MHNPQDKTTETAEKPKRNFPTNGLSVAADLVEESLGVTQKAAKE